MNKVVIALAVGVLTAGSALASDKEDIMGVLKLWISGEAGTVATCAEDGAVVDDIPPFEWHGPGACSRWQKDNEAYLQEQGITDEAFTIGNPQQLIISGDRAYAVLLVGRIAAFGDTGSTFLTARRPSGISGDVSRPQAKTPR